MEEIFALAKELSNRIIASDDYKDYKQAHEQLVQNLHLYNKVCEFRKLQIEDRLSLEDHSFDQEKYLSKLYVDLSLHPVVAAFFQAEATFLASMEKIQKIMGEDIEVDLLGLGN